MPYNPQFFPAPAKWELEDEDHLQALNELSREQQEELQLTIDFNSQFPDYSDPLAPNPPSGLESDEVRAAIEAIEARKREIKEQMKKFRR